MESGAISLNIEANSGKKKENEVSKVKIHDNRLTKRKEPENPSKQKDAKKPALYKATDPSLMSLDKVEKGGQKNKNEEEWSVFGKSISSFEDFKLGERITKCISESLKLTKPTLIQQLGLSFLLKNQQDAMIKAETGSGKTLTYLIPIMEKLTASSSADNKMYREEGTYAIILAPTRELCMQIQNTLVKLARPFPWLIPGAIMGGEKKKSEKARLRKGVSLLVATPGRLLDHLKTTESFKVENLQFLVLDEADRLLDMGFERDVSLIVSMLRLRVKNGNQYQLKGKKKGQDEDNSFQTILISATLQEGIQRLAGENLKNPQFISTDPKENDKDKAKKSKSSKSEEVEEQITEKTEEFSAPKQLHQYYVNVDCKERLVTLVSFLRWKAVNQIPCKMILFCSSCDSVDFLYSILSQSKYPFLEKKSFHKKGEEEEEVIAQPLIPLKLFRLHGNLPQVDRTKIYLEYNDAEAGLLICTDVAARGMDFPGVDWIIQYDPPGETREYVHRVGRTARVGKIGNALVFLQPCEMKYVDLLRNHSIEIGGINEEDIKAKLPQDNRYNMAGSAALQIYYERMVLDDEELARLARKGFSSFVKAYSTHSKETKHIFHVRNLHLGHLAKSFGLREQPKLLMQNQAQSLKSIGKEEKKQAHMKAANKRRGETMQSAYTSEFGSGL
eukprot:TRINITY_DN7664_c0_g1_i1.p1 TRINITY_DN7664_c0_g1~~TRINITY_DN7664_c0_g1_i1.p1  ORF type:complete len:691 (+),score=308.33 TRINITY_DN7664_c0_g1_i1:55-2073(+)